MEEVVINGLMSSENYFSKVYSHLGEELFKSADNNFIFKSLSEYVNKYDARPSFKDLGLYLKESSISVNQKKLIIEKFKLIVMEGSVDNIDFLLSKTENWVQKVKLTDTVFKAADIIKADGEFDPIVEMVENSLNISFDTSVGLDYNESEDERLEYYKSKEAYTSIGLKSIDSVLGGGIRPSSLFVFIGATHEGKTAAKVSTAANFLLKKENVLFITLEMPEKEIAKRIDANLMGTTINELSELPNEVLKNKWNVVKDNIGKLVVKEYGAGTFNVLHLKTLLDELKTKRGFIPDAICIDYLGLMSSHRASAQANSYELLGKVAEDLHALAKVTYDSKGAKGIKMITSSQANRCLKSDSELTLKDGTKIEIKDIKVNDVIKGFNKDVKVKNVIKTRKQKVYKVKLKSGKIIMCSDNHRFPTDNGLLNINNGLSVGNKVSSEQLI